MCQPYVGRTLGVAVESSRLTFTVNGDDLNHIQITQISSRA